jgi:hypothetical protein
MVLQWRAGLDPRLAMAKVGPMKKGYQADMEI